MDLRVLLVADDPLVRAGLATLLTAQEGCTIVGQAAGGEGINSEVEVYQPEVVLWDLGWEASEEGLSSLQSGLASTLSVPVVTLLANADSVSSVWAAGVQGMLTRDATPEQILQALHSASMLLTTLDPTLADALLPVSNPVEGLAPIEELTPREYDVLQLLAEGLPNKTIARRLEISEHTVKFHVNAILSKMGAASRTEAVVRAMRAGLIVL